IYAVIQFSAVLKDSRNYSVLSLLLYSIILLFTLTTFGAIFDQKKYALNLERIRLISMLILPQFTAMKSLFLFQSHLIIQIFIILSFLATFFITPIAPAEKDVSIKNK
ncbi:unnamed protein product, partial [Adineta steineri]